MTRLLLIAGILLAGGGLMGEQCYLVKGATSGMVERLENAVQALPTAACTSWTVLLLSGDSLADRALLRQTVKEGDIVLAVGSESARHVSGLRGVEKRALLVPDFYAMMNQIGVVSPYPKPQLVFRHLAAKGVKSLALLHSPATKMEAMYLSLASGPAGFQIEPVEVVSPVDIPIALRKALIGRDGAALCLDARYFDAVFLKQILDEIHRDRKLAVAFFKPLLSQGVDIIYSVKEEEIAAAAVASLATARRTGLIEIPKVQVDVGESLLSYGGWNNENIQE